MTPVVAPFPASVATTSDHERSVSRITGPTARGVVPARPRLPPASPRTRGRPPTLAHRAREASEPSETAASAGSSSRMRTWMAVPRNLRWRRRDRSESAMRKAHRRSRQSPSFRVRDGSGLASLQKRHDASPPMGPRQVARPWLRPVYLACEGPAPRKHAPHLRRQGEGTVPGRPYGPGHLRARLLSRGARSFPARLQRNTAISSSVLRRRSGTRASPAG
jgi:hypothetical protein